MAIGSGLDAQIGFALESPLGDYTAPTNFYEFTSESLSLSIERIESKGIRPGRRAKRRWAEGKRSVAGDVSLELAAESTGMLLEHALGAVSTTGGGPWVHRFTPGDLSDKSLSAQVGRPDVNGVVHPFSYNGLKVASWSLEASVDDFLMLNLSLVGRNEVTSESLETAAYPATYNPFVFTQGGLTIAGVENCVSSFSFNGDNGLKTDRHFICSSTTSGEPRVATESGQRSYSGSLNMEFENLTNYNRFVNGTEGTLVLTFDNPTSSRSLVLTSNVRFDGDTPNVSGMDTLEQTINFESISSVSDTDALRIDLENGESTP